MSRLEVMTAVWENPEAAYQNFLNRGGNLTRTDYVRKIALIQNGSFSSSLLYGVLGSEVTSYGPKEHDDMNSLKNVIAAVANYLLLDSTGALNTLDGIVAAALKKSLLSEVSEESRFSFEDCYVLQGSSGIQPLETCVNSGIFDTAVRCKDDGSLDVIVPDTSNNNYFYAADVRDLKIFEVLYESGLLRKSNFFDNIFKYVQAAGDSLDNERGFAFCDSSLIVQKGDTIIFAGKNFNVKKGVVKTIDGTNYLELATEGAFQMEHLIFCGV